MENDYEIPDEWKKRWAEEQAEKELQQLSQPGARNKFGFDESYYDELEQEYPIQTS